MDPIVTYVVLLAVGIAIERSAHLGVSGFTALAIVPGDRHHLTVPERRPEVEPVSYRERRLGGLRGGVLAGPARIDDGVVVVDVDESGRATVRDLGARPRRSRLPALRLVATPARDGRLDLRAYTLPRYLVPFGLPLVVALGAYGLAPVPWVGGLLIVAAGVATLAAVAAGVQRLGRRLARPRLQEEAFVRASTLLVSHVRRVANQEAGLPPPPS